MKYSIRYYKGCPILNEADEIIIKYTKKDPEILNFVKQWKEEQTVVLDVSTLTKEELEDNHELFKAANKVHDIKIMGSRDQSDFFLFYCQYYPVFFKEPVSSLDDFNYSINILKVSDIYITNELGFMLKHLGTYCHKDNIDVKVRVIPNVAQSDYNLSIKSFFIRPEDLYLYEDYVDIIEFRNIALDKQPVLYNIYKEGRWNDNLNMIINGLYPTINNMSIVPLFGTARINCGKQCAYGKCDICDHVQTTAKVLEEKEIYIVKQKQK